MREFYVELMPDAATKMPRTNDIKYALHAWNDI